MCCLANLSIVLFRNADSLRSKLKELYNISLVHLPCSVPYVSISSILYVIFCIQFAFVLMYMDLLEDSICIESVHCIMWKVADSASEACTLCGAHPSFHLILHIYCFRSMQTILSTDNISTLHLNIVVMCLCFVAIFPVPLWYLFVFFPQIWSTYCPIIQCSQSAVQAERAVWHQYTATQSCYQEPLRCSKAAGVLLKCLETHGVSYFLCTLVNMIPRPISLLFVENAGTGL